jgi:hypothetical protein
MINPGKRLAAWRERHSVKICLDSLIMGRGK